MINRQSVPLNGFALHEGGLIFGTVKNLKSHDAYAAYDIQIVRISLLIQFQTVGNLAFGPGRTI